MGNAAACFASGPVVKVMLPDATIKEYDHAIQVAELALMYPNYAVVHCSRAKPGRGRLRAVIVMKTDEFLVPGQAYIMYRVPNSFNDSLHVSDPSSPAEAGGDMKSKIGNGELEGPVITADELEKSLSRTLMGPALGRKVPLEGACLLDLENEEREQKAKKQQKEQKVEADLASEGPAAAWTPDLYQITED